MSGGAAAKETDSFEWGVVSITSDDGSVETIAIYGANEVEWDGFENPAQSFDLDIDARVKGSGNGWIDIHETGEVQLDSEDWGDNEALSGPGTSGSIETAIGLHSSGNHDDTTDWHIVGEDPDEYGLPDNSIDPSLLEVDEDGSDGEFTIELRSAYTWYDGDGNAEFGEEFFSTVDVDVTNEARSASGSASNAGATGT